MSTFQHQHEVDEMGQVPVAAGIRRPPAPATESVGPPLTDLVSELRRTAAGLEMLYRQARLESMYRVQRGVTQSATDSNGDALLELFTVPGGATGYLMFCALDMAGVTPAAPDTNANLWHALYGAAGGERSADVVAVGQLFDFQLNAPTRGDAMLPDTYKYGDKVGAPSLIGPLKFFAVIDGATASRQVAARWAVLVEQPEP